LAIIEAEKIMILSLLKNLASREKAGNLQLNVELNLKGVFE